MKTVVPKVPRTSDRVARYLVDHIRAFSLQPGAQLPSEVQASTDLGVSRGIIREAYRSLDMAGIIASSNGRAPRVGQIGPELFTHVFEHALATRQISPMEVLEIRGPIEVRSAELAAVKRTEYDADALLMHAAAFKKAGSNLEKLVAADMDFHETLGRATGNLLFSVVGGALRESLKMSIRAGLSGRTRESLALVVEIHRSIATCVSEGDAAGARQHMTRHFDEARIGLSSPAVRPPAPGRERAQGPAVRVKR